MIARPAGTATYHVGTSGWVYGDWRGRFYPQGLPQARWLSFYAQHFDTVELNAPFYRLPTEAAVARWRDLAPPGFRYAVKASRLITHLRRLRDCAEPLALFLDRVRPLGAALGPLLVQLPPSLARDDDLLVGFLDLLPSGLAATVEFRHPSWYCEAVYALLRAHGVALCVHDWRAQPCPDIVTAPLAYYRFHGPSGRYYGAYGVEGLRPWAERLRAAAATAREVYAYFNNDVGGAALEDARTLRELLAA